MPGPASYQSMTSLDRGSARRSACDPARARGPAPPTAMDLLPLRQGRAERHGLLLPVGVHSPLHVHDTELRPRMNKTSADPGYPRLGCPWSNVTNWRSINSRRGCDHRRASRPGYGSRPRSRCNLVFILIAPQLRCAVPKTERASPGMVASALTTESYLAISLICVAAAVRQQSAFAARTNVAGVVEVEGEAATPSCPPCPP